MNGNPEEIAQMIKVGQALKPALYAAGAAQDGEKIDRQGFDSLDLVVSTAALGGAPATQSQVIKVQHSDTAAGVYADFEPNGVGSGTVTITAADTLAHKSISLRGAKRWLKAVRTTTFTAGTAPTIASAAQFVLGSAEKLPTNY